MAEARRVDKNFSALRDTGFLAGALSDIDFYKRGLMRTLRGEGTRGVLDENVDPLLVRAAFEKSVMPGVNEDALRAYGEEFNRFSPVDAENFSGGALGTLSRKQLKQFVARAKKNYGATADWATGHGVLEGQKQAPGYMVARRGVTGTREGSKLESTSPELSLPVIDDYISKPDVLAALKRPGAKLGTWQGKDAQGNPLWYMDVSENIPSRQAAASALINRGEQAAFNTRGNPKRETAQIVSDVFPSFPTERTFRSMDTNVRKRAAMSNAEAAGLPQEAERLTNLARTEPRPTVPDGPEYWPWRIERGGYTMKYNPRPDQFDPGPGHYSINKVQSKEEQALAKKIKEAEDALKRGEIKGFFGAKDVIEQPYRDTTLLVPYPKKAMPQWLQDNLGAPELEENLVRAFEGGRAAKPDAPKWYWTGRIYNDLLKRAKGDVFKAEKGMERLGDYAGTTTASSKPPQNFRTATYHMAREQSGLPVGEVVQYPYGHKMYETHADAMRSLEAKGYIDPMQNPKGAHFSGNLSGLTDDATLDKVMSNKAPLLNASGKVTDAPEYYGPARDTWRMIANKHGNRPSEFQASPWVFWNPEGGRTAIETIGDRIAITARVTGMKPEKIYENFLRLLERRKGASPLLSTGLLSLGGEEDRQQ